MNYEEGIELNTKILDEIDIRPYLKVGKDIRCIMRELQDNYEVTGIPDMNGDLFNFYSYYDFKSYLERRYHIKVFHYLQEVFEITDF